MIQDQLVLDCRFPIFPGYRPDVEHVIGTEEGFTQCRVSPLSLLADQFGNDPGITLGCIDLGFIPYMQVIQPFCNLRLLGIEVRIGILEILFQVRQLGRIFPIDEWLLFSRCDFSDRFH